MTPPAEQHRDLLSAVVQVRDGRGRPAGTGFLIADRLVVTCAHVLAVTGGGPPAEPVSVVFTHLDDTTRSVRVDPDLWRAPADGDVAFLHVTGGVPAPARVLPLGPARAARRHRVRTFGFPVNAPGAGHHGYGVAGDLIRGDRGEPLLQLTDCTEVTEGFSGGPVLDEQTGLVIGMVDSVAAPDRLGRGAATAYVTPTETLRAICPRLVASETCPYRGLEPFGAADAQWFHGRDRAVAAVMASLRRDRGFLALLGPSGSGKSSLIQAGVLPALAAGALPGSDRWGRLTVRPGGDPYAQLEVAGLAGAGDRLPAAVRRWLDEHPGYDRLVLVLDQFEELLVATPDQQRARLLRELAELTEQEPAATVALTMRDDFYSRLAAAAPALMPLVERGLVNVPAVLDRAELAAIVERPAAAVGLTLEPGLSDRIVQDAAQLTAPGGATGTAAVTVLPLLESALTELWNRRDNGRLTHAAYERAGRVAGWLGRWCDQAYAEASRRLSAEQRPQVRQVVTALVRPGDEAAGIPPTRQRRTLDQVRGLVSAAGGVDGSAVIGALADQRLVVTGRDPASGDAVAELAHEALITEWQQLRRWLAEDAEFLAWRRDAEGDYAQWLASTGRRTAHDPALLLHGSALAAAREWQQRRPGELHTGLREFIRSSDEAERRRLTRDRRRVVVLSFLLVSALFLGLVAVLQAGRASDQAEKARIQSRTADSRRIAVQAVALADRQPDLAQLLALESLRTAPSLEAWGSLERTLSQPVRLSRQLTGPTNSVDAVDVSPDGKTVAAADEDGELRLWDATSGRLVGSPFPERPTLRGRPLRLGAVFQDVEFSPDGKLLATSNYDDGVQLWDVAGRRAVATLAPSLGFLGAVAFSPDGRLLAATQGASVHVFDVATRTNAGSVLEPRAGPLVDVAFDDDGRTLAATGELGLVTLWDTASRRPLQRLRLPAGASAFAFSPDGRRVAVGGEEGVVYLWDVAARKPVDRQFLHPTRVHALAFAPDGEALATGDTDGTVRLWDLDRGVQTGAPFTGHAGAVESLAFSPDGRTLVSGSADRTVRLWNLTERQALGTPLRGHVRSVRAVAFSGAGKRLVTGGFDTTTRVWDLAARKEIGRTGSSLGTDMVVGPDPVIGLSSTESGLVIIASGTGVRVWAPGSQVTTGLGRAEKPDAVAFSRDGRLVAVAAGGEVRLWDATSGKPSGRPLPKPRLVSAMALSPDSRLLAFAGGVNQGIGLWDVAAGKPVGELPLERFTSADAVAFSPDGRLLAMTSRIADEVRLFDVRTQKPLGGPLPNPQTFFPSLAFSPDGRLLAVGGGDNAVRLWDVHTREQFGDPLTGHNDQVVSVAFSSDGTLLASGSDDGTARLWATPRTWVRHACDLANRNLSQAEWDRYVGAGKGYIRHCAQYPSGPGAPAGGPVAAYPSAP